MNDMPHHHHHISRRGLLGGGAAMLTLGGGLRVAFGAGLPEALGGMPTGSSSGVPGTESAAAVASPILVVIFCRFGQDGLQLVAPSGDPNYIAARPTIRVQPNANMGLGTLDGVDMFFHPNMSELKALYDAKKLAPIVAAGVPTNIRSHFEAQDMMERGGADGTQLPGNGWLARHMNQQNVTAALSTVAVSTNMPISLMGDNQALAIPNPANFNVSGGTNTSNVIRGLTRGTTDYEKKAIETLDAITNVQTAYRALSNNTQTGYTGGDLSTPLRSLATLIKMNVGISVATVDMGGWDHHQNLTAAFNTRATELSRSISAFWNDLGTTYQPQVTIVTMTEFGRRFNENANRGLDHGSASTMMVLASEMNGGKLYGLWPGTAPNQLYGGDLAVTTDYRTIISEVLVKRHNETKIANVFPNVNYAPLGLFA